ncbi:hypothetical protein AB0D08_21410 [Kitasatospora sp. NPDC048540]|uniref:hypothetical protein n=1 Tax=unclassified Kitasatospora TaxID=2633591 RepID=UPI000539D022|nr:hypothetical protein [Kitasatospora sp. MBT63]
MDSAEKTLRRPPVGGWTVSLVCDGEPVTVHIPASDASNSYDAVAKASATAAAERGSPELRFTGIHADFTGTTRQP